MIIKSSQIVDTYAESFKMYASRIIITAVTKTWAEAAARSITGFATSIIGCRCEAGVEAMIAAEHTPDQRPGVSVLLFAMDSDSLQKRLVERIGQCVMTCPSTACFDGLGEGKAVTVGGQLRYFGDGYQISKVLGDKRIWRIPVMDGEFVVDDVFHITEAVGGGNFILAGKNQTVTLRSALAAAKAMQALPNVILPFPNGVVRSGSKVGSRYKKLLASTNEAYCPTLKGVAEHTMLPKDAHHSLEIVVNGLDLQAVEMAMSVGIKTAARRGIVQISAGNYGGELGQFKIALHKLFDES